MKKIILIALITLFACNKEDKSPVTVDTSSSINSSKLVGSWFLETINGTTMASIDSTMVDIIWDFNSDGTFKGDYILECFEGCDSAYYVYSYYSIEPNGYLKLVMYADSYGPSTDQPNYLIISSVSATELILLSDEYDNDPDVYYFTKL